MTYPLARLSGPSEIICRGFAPSLTPSGAGPDPARRSGCASARRGIMRPAVGRTSPPPIMGKMSRGGILRLAADCGRSRNRTGYQREQETVVRILPCSCASMSRAKARLSSYRFEKSRFRINRQHHACQLRSHRLALSTAERRIVCDPYALTQQNQLSFYLFGHLIRALAVFHQRRNGYVQRLRHGALRHAGKLSDALKLLVEFSVLFLPSSGDLRALRERSDSRHIPFSLLIFSFL